MCLGEVAIEFLIKSFNKILESERMPEEWWRSVLVPTFKNNRDVHSCGESYNKDMGKSSGS